MTPAKAKLILASIILVSLLGTAGIALPYPVLAPYFLDYPANDLNNFLGLHPKILLGFSLAIYPLGLLVGSIFIGALSDHYGRRKVLLLSLGGSVLGYLLTALAVYQESFIGFTLARLITGVCEGNIAIARAIAAELHPHIERTKAISLVYSANYGGWLIGPLAGGFLMPYGVAEVFAWAALGIVVAWVLVFFAIERGVRFRDWSESERAKTVWQLIRSNNSLTLLKHKPVLPIFWFYFLFSMGINAFYEFYPVWMVEKLDASSKLIALATVAMTAVMVLFSSFLVDKINLRLGEVRSILLGAAGLTIMLAVQPLLGLVGTFAVFGLIGGWIAITNGMVPTYLAKYFGHLGQGKVMGLQTSTFCITNVIIATIGGPLSILSTNLVLWLGAALVAAAWVTMVVTRHATPEIPPEQVVQAEGMAP